MKKPIVLFLLLASPIHLYAEYGSNLGSFAQPAQAGAVIGNVYSDTGQPIAGAFISGPWGMQVQSAADGSYKLPIDVPGQYQISISTGTADVQQNVDISPGAQVLFNVGNVPVPHIAFSPSSLAFVADVESSASAQSLTLSNTGTGTLNYTIGSNVGWLQVTPGSGFGAVHTVTASCATPDAGLRAATITISDIQADNSPVFVPVSLNCVAAAGDGDGSGGTGNDGSGNGTTEDTDPTTDGTVTEPATNELTPPTTANEDLNTGGCGCTVSGGSTLPEIWLFVALFALVRRRRSSQTG